MIWKQDTADYSWFATDAMGYFYRVAKVIEKDGSKKFACAWSETNGLRVSCHLYESADEAKFRMDHIAAEHPDEDVPLPPSHRETP